MEFWLLLIHAGATLSMGGLIWFVQVVHYPLFASVGRETAPAYFQLHTRLTGFVVVPLMLTELVTAVLLMWQPPSGVPYPALTAGLVLLVLVWVSTFVLQVPCHRQLSDGWDELTIRRLVRTNWIRTLLWSARSILVLWMVVRQLTY